MDWIQAQGRMMLASRLKRLSERLFAEVNQGYKVQQLAFESRWFPVFSLLAKQGALPIVELSQALGLSHPGVHKITQELEKAGLLTSTTDANDARRRLVSLSEQGQQLLPALQAYWSQLDTLLEDFLAPNESAFMNQLHQLEQALEPGTLTRTLKSKRPQTLAIHGEPVTFTSYEPHFKPAFAKLNYEWIQGYFTVEPEDERLLEAPEDTILAHGGFIGFAVLKKQAVGTFALIPHEEGLWELGKMAVCSSLRGHGVGRQLLQYAIEQAKRLNATGVWLESNRKLKSAIHLYRQLGFQELPMGASHFKRADIKMRLLL